MFSELIASVINSASELMVDYAPLFSTVILFALTVFVGCLWYGFVRFALHFMTVPSWILKSCRLNTGSLKNTFKGNLAEAGSKNHIEHDANFTIIEQDGKHKIRVIEQSRLSTDVVKQVVGD